MVLSPASTAEITLLNNVYRCSTVRKCRGRIATVFYQNTEQGEFTTCMKDTGWWRFKNWEVREEKVPREAIYQLKTIQNEIMKRMSFSSVQSLSRVRLFATPWIAARQAPLSITISWSSFRLTFIEPSHSRSSPSPPAPNPSQHQSLFQWVNSLHEVAKVLEFQL